jgi:hypothetical protein
MIEGIMAKGWRDLFESRAEFSISLRKNRRNISARRTGASAEVGTAAIE